MSGSSDLTLRIWDAHTGQILLGPLGGHTGSVLSVTYSPDGSHIASGSHDRSVRVWDAATGAQLGEFCGHNCGVRTVVFSPDSRRIASGSDYGEVYVWDATDDYLRWDI